MDAPPYIYTPNEEEEILYKKEYKVLYNSDYINIIIEKTKKNIIIRSDYYEIKLNIENLSLLTKVIYKSIDESFEYINNIFIRNKFKIKEKNSKIIKLIIIIYDNIKGKDKEIELFLKENFDNKNFLIKELYNKFMKLEQEIIEEKKNNKIIKEENNKLKQENMNIKNEIETIKNNHNNDIFGIRMNITNITNQLYQLQRQINQFIFQINQIQQKINLNSMNSNYNNNIMMMMNNNDFNPMIQSNNNLINFSNFNPMNQYSNQIDNFKEVDNSITVNFRISGKNDIPPTLITIQDNDSVSTLIDKYRNKENIYLKNVKFIFNAKQLPQHLTVKETGITNNANIFVVGIDIKITFKISGLIGSNNDDFEITIKIFSLKKISDLIDLYLDYSGFNRIDIERFEYNSKQLNMNKYIYEEGLENNSVIIAKIYKKINYITIFIKYYDKHSKEYKNPYKIKCLKTFKIKALIETYLNKFDFTDYIDDVHDVDAFLDSELLDPDKRIEETKLTNNSTIIIKRK